MRHTHIHILFDSYLDISVNECERARRKVEEEGIELATIDEFMTLSVQIENFWPVNTNKENLQLYTRKVAIQMIDNLILSNMVLNYEILVSLHKYCQKI